MAIKLIANYSKRLGLPGYSSHQFSVSVETELRDLTEADSEIQSLYLQLQQNVDAQIQETGFVPSKNYGAMSGDRQVPQSQPRTRSQRGHSQSPDQSHPETEEWQCSEKQEQFITQLMKENQLPLAEVDDIAHRRFGRPVQRLNKMQASGLIDAMLDQYGSKGKGGSR